MTRGVEHLGDLDSGDADARIRAQHQHGLSRTDGSASDEHVPRGQKDERHTGGLVEVERSRGSG